MDGYQEQQAQQLSSASPVRPSKQKSGAWVSTNIDLNPPGKVDAADVDEVWKLFAFFPSNAKFRKSEIPFGANSLALSVVRMVLFLHLAHTGVATNDVQN